MIVLDTNVISELMRDRPDQRVATWIASQKRADLYTTSVNEAELLHGVAALPEGRRRRGLAAAIQGVFAEEFAGRVLPFGGAAARFYSEIVAIRRLAEDRLRVSMR